MYNIFWMITICCEVSYLYIGLLTLLSYLTYVGFLNISDESDDDNSPPPRFERYRDFDDLPMDADAGQDNGDEMDSVDSDYDDKNLRLDN